MLVSLLLLKFRILQLDSPVHSKNDKSRIKIHQVLQYYSLEGKKKNDALPFRRKKRLFTSPKNVVKIHLELLQLKLHTHNSDSSRMNYKIRLVLAFSTLPTLCQPLSFSQAPLVKLSYFYILFICM